jgi:Flp pilus assembly protein TadD
MVRLIARAVSMALLLMLAGCASSPKAQGADADLIEMEQMAEQAYRQGNYARASDLYAGIVEAMPDQAEFWYRLGNAYARQGLSQEAALSYHQSLALDASNARGWHNLGMMQLKLANEAFVAGEKRGSRRARVNEENRRLANATSSILEDDSASTRQALPGNPPPEELGIRGEAGGKQ